MMADASRFRSTPSADQQWGPLARIPRTQRVYELAAQRARNLFPAFPARPPFPPRLVLISDSPTGPTCASGTCRCPSPLYVSASISVCAPGRARDRPAPRGVARGFALSLYLHHVCLLTLSPSCRSGSCWLLDVQERGCDHVCTLLSMRTATRQSRR